MSVIARNNVTVTGAPERPPMVFVHGLATDQRIWRYVAPAFEADHRLVLYDQIGSGGSDRDAYDPDRYGSLHGFAADLLEICEELDLHDVVMVGHSAGAMIGMLAAIEAPERFASLVLLGASPRYLDDDDYVGGFTRQAVDDLLDSMAHNYGAWCDEVAPLFMGHPGRVDLSRKLAATLRSANPAVARDVMETILLSDHRDDLLRVTTPSLVIQASDEPIAPLEVAEFVHERLSDSRLVVLRAAGHFPQVSAPAETIAAMHDFLTPRARRTDVEPPEVEELSDLYEHAPFGYVSTDLDWRITRINATLLAWLERSGEQLLGRPFTDLLTAAGGVFHRTHCVPAVRLHGVVREVTVDLIRADGSAMPALISAVVRDGGPNTSPAIRVTVLDAAQRRRHERDLQAARRRSEVRLQRLQQAIADSAGAATVAQIGQVLSEAAVDAFGAIEATLWLVEADGSALVAAGSKEVIALTGSRPEATAFGTSELVIDPARRIAATEVRCGDHRIGVLALEVDDVTALQPDERELLRDLGAHVGQAVDRARAYEARGRLLSVVSHELRTPLTPIIGFSELALRRHPMSPDELRRVLEIIQRNGEHLVTVVDGLLELTRSRRGELLAVPRSVGLGPFLTELLEELDARHVGLELRQADAVAWIDPQHLSRVIVNLLSNAERYGRPPITIEVDSDDVTARLVVADRGPGVPERFVPQLFDEFTQADAGDRRESGGLGLGLAIARELVANSGGVLSYEHGGDGARFVVSLPRAPTSGPGPTEAGEASPT